MNASHFLFTFDLPLSPQKPEKKERKGRGGEARQREGREGEERRGKMGGWRAPPPSLSISPLSLSPSFFSFCLSKEKLDGQFFATSSLQPVQLSRFTRGFFANLNAKQIQIQMYLDTNVLILVYEC